jgi:hypothetical protein
VTDRSDSSTDASLKVSKRFLDLTDRSDSSAVPARFQNRIGSKLTIWLRRERVWLRGRRVEASDCNDCTSSTASAETRPINAKQGALGP